jgi:hypothetical protein
MQKILKKAFMPGGVVTAMYFSAIETAGKLFLSFFYSVILMIGRLLQK